MSDGIRLAFKVGGDPVPVPDASAWRPNRAAWQLALAHRIELAIENGELRSYAEASRVLGLSRARLSQLVASLALPAAAVERVLGVSPSAAVARQRRTRRMPR